MGAGGRSHGGVLPSYEGALVEIDCSVLGVYRGVIKRIDEHDQSVAIRHASKDGKKLVHSDVVIAAADIANIRFVNKLSSNSSNCGSPVLKERNSPSCGRSPLKTPRLDNNHTPNHKQHQQQQRQQTFSNSLSTSRARRDKECFGQNGKHHDAALSEDFDFEKNLELFNKQKVFAEIDRALDVKGESNVVRLADCNIRKDKKYRHDENVLSNSDKIVGKDDMKRQSNAVVFTVGPSGSVRVPAVARSARDAVLSEAIRRGMSGDSLREATARNLSSLILQQNKRQTVVFVVSPEKVSAPLNMSLCGITAARQLASGGKVSELYVLTTRSVTAEDAAFQSELLLAELAGVRVVRSAAELPAAAKVDIVVGCSLHAYLDQVAAAGGGTVLLVDPPFYSPNLASIVLFPLLPLLSAVPPLDTAVNGHNGNSTAGSGNKQCRMYIGDLAIPAKLYSKAGVDNAEGIYPCDGFVARITRAGAAAV